jgi:hypothetical protein
LALVTAGLERDVKRCPDRILLARFDRGDLCVCCAIGGVVTLPEDLSVTDDDGADERVGTRVPPAVLGQLQCALDVLKIVVGQRLPLSHPVDVSSTVGQSEGESVRRLQEEC